MSEELKKSIAASIENTRFDILQMIELGRQLIDYPDEMHHGPVVSMGVPKDTLPRWNDIQILTAQLHKKPLMDDVPVDTRLVIGPRAQKPLVLDIPLLVADMSYGALSKRAKQALSKGADLAGTAICSGEGGILRDELDLNQSYMFELGSARNGLKKNSDLSQFAKDFKGKVRAFHFKGGQAAKTGTGGHLPGGKVTEEIARARQIEVGKDAISPSTFADFHTPRDFADFADQIRDRMDGIPIGFKISANHIEADIRFALDAGADYIILDGRGGSTGAAPAIFRDHISVPTIAALARARKFLDAAGHEKGAKNSVTLIITGGLRTPSDFIKALALGADGIALANSALQAIGCTGARICYSGDCPAGIATHAQHLVNKIDIDARARDLALFFTGTVHLMKIMTRACGYHSLREFSRNDICTWKAEMSRLAGIPYAGVDPSIPGRRN